MAEESKRPLIHGLDEAALGTRIGPAGGREMNRRLTVCLVLCMMALAPCGAHAELAHDESGRDQGCAH
jgi:hypothetical protein